MMKIFTDLLGGEVRHFDYAWFRSVAPGLGTSPHCDSVYMNRGTQKLFTAWTPIGDCTLEMGGLMILEGSSRNQRLRETYCATDVDSFCVNRDGRAGKDAWQKGTSGALSRNPVQVQHSLGGRWLTNEYHAGDLLIFSIFTVHASLDNHSRTIRLSCDSRYQLASEAVDERWIGEKPIAHGEAGKRGRIC
jgi:ectoine hydroxylase-related dioxygenase (phytanoyl-CoA dioxygenase family)